MKYSFDSTILLSELLEIIDERIAKLGKRFCYENDYRISELKKLRKKLVSMTREDR